MEAAGLAVGAIALIKPICTTINETLTNYKSFGRDAERLRLRFSVSQTRLDAFEHVLFDLDKFPGMRGRLADHMPKRTLDDVIGLLRQLYALMVEYAAAREQYRIQDRAGGDSSVAAALFLSGIDGEAFRELTQDKQRRDAAQQKKLGWARKVQWVAFDKSSTEKLVSEFEAWTGRMQALLEAAAWPMIFFQGLERIRKLENDADLKSAGLLDGVGVLKVLAAGEDAVPVETHAEEIVPRRFVASKQVSPASGMEVGRLEGFEGRFLVEYKNYQPAAFKNASVQRQRVVQLAALLHEAPVSDAGLRVLRCTHFFEDTPRSKFGLVYEFPDASSEENGEADGVPTLADVLDAGYTGNRPSLSARMRLAHKLALCVQRLHSYSWLHKSLRSEKILLFPSADPTVVDGNPRQEDHGGVEPAVAPAALDPDTLGDPRVVGFEYSRQETDFSDQFGEEDLRRNLYRHPTRWGDPTKRFEKIHDIYGQLLPSPPQKQIRREIFSADIIS